MTRSKRIVLLFLAAGALVIVGALLKVLHAPAADSLLLVGILAQLAAFGAFLWHQSGRKG